jgi:DNA-binding transcriptional ArsR family regulator
MLDLQPALSMTLETEGVGGYLGLAFIVMLLAGMLGGFITWQLTTRRQAACQEEPDSLKRHLSLGVLSALVVPPLVLTTLSSSLLESTRFNPSAWFVFAALCLVSVLLVWRFIDQQTIISSRREELEALQDEIERLRQAQEALYRHLEPVLEAADKTVSREALTYHDLDILRALSDESYLYGNLAALTEKTGLGRELITQRLAVLKNLGLIDTRVNDGKALHWLVSLRGRQILSQEEQAKTQEIAPGGKPA